MRSQIRRARRKGGLKKQVLTECKENAESEDYKNLQRIIPLQSNTAKG
jgi:hypothetical protein